MDCLSRSQRGLLENGIEQAKQMLTVIFRQTQTTLETHQVMSAGPFLYLILDEVNINFKKDNILNKMVFYIMINKCICKNTYLKKKYLKKQIV